MSDSWYYSKNNQKHGPIETDRLKELAAAGMVSPADMLWKEGMPNWQPAGSVPDLFPPGPPPLMLSPPVMPNQAPPPLPPGESGGLPQPTENPLAALLKGQHPLKLAYIGALAVLLLALMGPWITATGTSSVRFGDLGNDLNRSGYGGYGGGQAYQNIGNQSSSTSFSVSGLETLWGKGIFLLLAAGVVLAVIGPGNAVPAGKRYFVEQEKVLMAAVGGVAALLAIVVLLTVGSYINQGASVDSKYVSTSAGAAVDWGWYLGVLSALTSSVLGYLVPWRANP